jgi:hypothetical protein
MEQTSPSATGAGSPRFEDREDDRAENDEHIDTKEGREHVLRMVRLVSHALGMIVRVA